jgi:8-oxo-dGTP pyrophosphatase MutT (NUDIX family)
MFMAPKLPISTRIWSVQRQFTASVYIIDGDKVLLIYHKKLQKWLQPGGHIEPNETPSEAARREVKEETGLDIAFLRQENIWIDHWNARSIERPFMCSLQEIPAYKDVPAHQHMDMAYVATPVGEKVGGDHEMRWFSLQEIQQLVPDDEIFKETQEVVAKLLDIVLQLQ